VAAAWSEVKERLELESSFAKVEVHATKKVRRGEELCVSYLDDEEIVKLSTAERREKLSAYHFVCKCARCKPRKAPHG
jgi:hypothetical protein